MYARTSRQDQRVNEQVIRQLSNHGVGSPCKVAVSTREGSTTLSGQIEYEHQRRLAMRVAQNTAGVKRVVDQLQVVSKTSPWKQHRFTTL
jgi:osmotically-inducible protein OsmY